MSGGSWRARLGAIVDDDGTSFCTWAPIPRTVELVLGDRVVPMTRDSDGYWRAVVAGLGAGARYRYRLDGEDVLPDPCSRSQPEGVHGDSEVVDPRNFAWSDHDWRPPSRENVVVYECHVGTLTTGGTFDDAIAELARIRELGVTALELMPVASFPGSRNWGYDGVDLFAPSAAYGGPEAMRRFVDAAHHAGLAVILDVVYNHFGPEGNYTGRFGPYQTEKHQTPWGGAVNFDDAGSHGVRQFVVENLLHWVHEYHVDGFRFDATHAIKDDSREHILAEIRRRLDSAPRAGHVPYLIAETDENDVRYLRPRGEGGFGFDAVWADDFHNVVRNILHSEREGYLRSFEGTIDELARVVSRGWLYEGQADPWAKRPRGTPALDRPWRQFLYCLQNHDQVGNRAFGERLNQTARTDDIFAATLLLLLLPQTPLIFQGQEFLATTPFLFFTDHSPDLGHLVTEGRRREFADFAAFRDPEVRARIPDPQALDTFARSKLRRDDMERPEGRGAFAFHRELLKLRSEDPVLRAAREDHPPIRTEVQGQALLVVIETSAGSRAIAVNLGEEQASFPFAGEVLFRSGGSPAGEPRANALIVAAHSGVFARPVEEPATRRSSAPRREFEPAPPR